MEITPIFHNLKSIILDHPLKKGKLMQGRYEIIRTLGMGSYGITYLVEDHTQKSRCVLKQMKPSRKKVEKVQVSFAYEKEILSLQNHPQIPKFRESFNNDGHYFFTMDYIDGRTFEDLIFNDGIVYNEIESFQILRQVLEIVAYIHSQNIVHRDLRIPNIMQQDGQIFIVDFGLARFFQDDRNTVLPGMDGYDIEKKLKREIHYKSDFYALGHFVLFLLYSGYTPSSKKESSWEEELPISIYSRKLIRRLLQIDEPYMCVEDVVKAVEQIK